MATRKKSSKDPKENLLKLWEARPPALFQGEFRKYTDSEMSRLIERAEKLESPAITGSNAGKTHRVYQKTWGLSNVHRSDAAKLLLLESGNNGLADAMEKHLMTKYDSKMVKGCPRVATVSAFASILSCLDNVPTGFLLSDLTRCVYSFLLENPEETAEKLNEHLNKTTRSYKKLVLDLGQRRAMNSAIDFYVGAARLFLDIPILLVKPKEVELADGTKTFTFTEERLIEADRKLKAKDFPITLAYNGVNHYTPFYPHAIADLISKGRPAVKNLFETFQQFKDLAKDIPVQSPVNGAVQQILTFVQAAGEISRELRFSSGIGGRIEYDNVSEPRPHITEAPVSRKRKPTATATSEESKKSKPSEVIEEEEMEVDQSVLPHRKDCNLLPNQCPCGIECQNAERYTNHIATVHKNNYWACSGTTLDEDGKELECEWTFGNRATLWQHFRKVHERRFQNYCSVKTCAFGCDELSEVRKHEYKEHGVTETDVLKCTTCNKVFGQKHLYKKHVVLCGTKNKPYKCDCPKEFRQFDNYQRHLRQFHNPDPSDESAWYFCRNAGCDKKYTSVSGLTKHGKVCTHAQ